MPDIPHASRDPERLTPLVVILGPTASGKSTLAVNLAEQIGGEIVSCDAVSVYQGLDVGSAKPTAAERARVPHHGLDLLTPDQPSTAGDYARMARAALKGISSRDRLPLLVGGTGLYLRATLDGLAPAPLRDEALRDRLRARAARRGRGGLHRLLQRLDPQAAVAIHPHDEPKLIRSLEMCLLGHRPQSEQWQAGRTALEGYDTLQIGLDPPRADLYEHINARAAAMLQGGLLEETERLLRHYGPACPALRSLGYAEAVAVLEGRLGLAEAVAAVQTGHRHYAKRQMTWFRRDRRVHWLQGFGSEPRIQSEARRLVVEHLMRRTDEVSQGG